MIICKRILMTVAHKQHRRSPVRHDKIILCLRTARIYRDAGKPVLERTELSYQNLGGIGRAYGDSVFFYKTEHSQSLCGDIHLHGELFPGCRQPFTVLAPAEAVSFASLQLAGILGYYFNQFICHLKTTDYVITLLKRHSRST